MSITTGVFPCYENQFQINAKAEGAQTDNWVTIADCETFEVSFDNGVEEWTPFDSEGWVRRLMTAKNITLSVSGKRNRGDAGNDYIAGLGFKNGRDAEVDFRWIFPDSARTMVEFAGCPINVTALMSGDSTAVAPLEFEILSNGKPTLGTAPTP